MVQVCSRYDSKIPELSIQKQLSVLLKKITICNLFYYTMHEFVSMAAHFLSKDYIFRMTNDDLTRNMSLYSENFRVYRTLQKL